MLSQHKSLFDDDKTGSPTNNNWTQQPLHDNLLVRPKGNQTERERGKKHATIMTHLYTPGHFQSYKFFFQKEPFLVTNIQKSLPGFWYLSNSHKRGLSCSNRQKRGLPERRIQCQSGN